MDVARMQAGAGVVQNVRQAGETAAEMTNHLDSPPHTQPPFAEGGNPFEGQTEIINTAQFLAGGTQFGPITAPNLTPDEHGRPASLTFEQFEHLMRTGRDDERILQVMPWDIYGKMTQLDLRAIYEYLRAVPALPNNTIPAP